MYLIDDNNNNTYREISFGSRGNGEIVIFLTIFEYSMSLRMYLNINVPYYNLITRVLKIETSVNYFVQIRNNCQVNIE